MNLLGLQDLRLVRGQISQDDKMSGLSVGRRAGGRGRQPGDDFSRAYEKTGMEKKMDMADLSLACSLSTHMISRKGE